MKQCPKCTGTGTGFIGNPCECAEGYRQGLADAIERDHPDCSCGSCDISAALRAGFVYSAAHLLSGATECPNLDRFRAKCGALPMGGDGWPIDWAEWVEWFRANSRKCSECGAFTFTDEGEPDSCANCLKPLPPAPPPPALRDALRAAKGCAATLRILSGDEVGDGSAWQEEARRLAVHLRGLADWFDEVAGGAPGADEVARVAALAAGLDD